MADNEIRGYIPLLDDEQLLAEYYGQFDNPMLGGNVTAKQNTPIGLLTGTVGENYDLTSKEFNPYAEANLYGNGYNVRAAMDEYAKTLGGNYGNFSAGVTETPYDTIKSLGYNTPEYGANVSQDSSGTYFDANKNFNMFDGQGILKLFKNPYDEGIEFLYGRDF